MALADITTTIIITTSLPHSSPLSLSLQPPEGEKWQSCAREPTTNTVTEKEEDKKNKTKKAHRLASLFPSLIIQNIIKNKMYLYQIRSFPSHVTLLPSSSSFSSSSIPSNASNCLLYHSKNFSSTLRTSLALNDPNSLTSRNATWAFLTWDLYFGISNQYKVYKDLQRYRPDQTTIFVGGLAMG